jgi:hypothetical protein
MLGIPDLDQYREQPPSVVTLEPGTDKVRLKLFVLIVKSTKAV